MSRWIDKDALIEAMGEEPYVWTDSAEEIAERNQWLTDMGVIESAPSIDIVPKRGEWIDIGGYEVCKNCHEVKRFPHWKFCPNCGAKMDGEREGE